MQVKCALSARVLANLALELGYEHCAYATEQVHSLCNVVNNIPGRIPKSASINIHAYSVSGTIYAHAIN